MISNQRCFDAFSTSPFWLVKNMSVFLNHHHHYFYHYHRLVVAIHHLMMRTKILHIKIVEEKEKQVIEVLVKEPLKKKQRR